MLAEMTSVSVASSYLGPTNSGLRTLSLYRDCKVDTLYPNTCSKEGSYLARVPHPPLSPTKFSHLKLVSAFEPPGELLEPVPGMVGLSL